MFSRTWKSLAPLLLAICVLAGCVYLCESGNADPNKVSTLEYSAEVGLISATINNSDHSVLSSGSIFPAEGVTIQYILPLDNYEFLYWIIETNGAEDISHTENPLVLTAIDSDTVVTPKVRYYSQSNSLSNIYHLNTKFENAFEQWGYFSPETKGGSGMAEWTVTSTPLIVDDFVYTYCGNQIYKIQGSTGVVVAQDAIEPLNGVYYRYLGYGGGYIIDYNSGKIFDLDLNRVATIDKTISSSFYHEGYFYGLFHDVLKKFSIVENSNGVSVEYVSGFSPSVAGWHGIYGTTSSPVFANGYMYYIGASTTTVKNTAGQDVSVPYKIFLNSINTETGAKQTIDLGLDYKYIDDGWLTYDGQFLYVTSYVGGLDMGGGEDGTDNSSVYEEKTSSVTRIAIDGNGNMEKLFDVDFDEKGVTSQFVVYNGRGYVNVNQNNGFLYVYDMSTFSADSRPIYKNQSVYTHGSIVLNTYDDGSSVEKIQIYMISYQLRNQGICVIEDYEGKTTASNPQFYFDGYDIANYCSQGVRFLPNGNVVFYQDPGCLVCVGPEDTNDYFFFITDDQEAKWVKASGKMPSNALDASGYALISDDGYTLLQATTDLGKTMSGNWSVFVLNQKGTEWIKVPNNYLNKGSDVQDYYRFCHYYQIVKTDDAVSYGTEWDCSGQPYVFKVPLLNQSILEQHLTFTAGETRYSVHTDYVQSEGSVIVSENNPIVDSTVTLTVTPASRYAIQSVLYSVAGQPSQELQASSEGVYRFRMPSTDVTVAVSFIPIYTITYHVGDGAGKDISLTENVYVNAQRDYTVYAGYDFEINISNPMSNNRFENIPSWLIETHSVNNPSIIEKYSGVVEGSDCNFSIISLITGNNKSYVVNLHVGYFQDSFVKGGAIVADIPSGVTNHGKSFIGWSIDPSSDRITYRPGSSFELNSDLTLYAVWSDGDTSDPTSVHYVLSETSTQSNGKTDIDVYINRDIGDKDLKDARLLIIANYDGGIFVNVYSIPSLKDGVGKERVTVSSQGLVSVTVQIVSGISDGLFCWYGECTYHAGEGAKGAVIFESQYGSVPAAAVGDIGSTIILGSIEVDGLKFDGWVVGTDVYAAGDRFTIIDGETILTARWIAIPTHSVTYLVDGGSDEAPTQDDVAEGSTFIVASYAGTKEGMEFAGWNDEQTDYQVGSTYTMGTSNVTLTAVWIQSAPTYTVSFSSSKGNPVDPVTGHAGDRVTLPTYDLALYQVSCWKIGDAEVQGDVYIISADDADANNTIALTAVWERKNLDLTVLTLPASQTYTVVELGGDADQSFAIETNETLTVTSRLVTYDGSNYTLVKLDNSAINADSMFTLSNLGRLDNGNYVWVLTVSKDLADYRQDVSWTHARLALKSPGYGFFAFTYPEPEPIQG